MTNINISTIKTLKKDDIDLISNVKYYRNLLSMTQSELGYLSSILSHNMNRLENIVNLKLFTAKKFLDAFNLASKMKSVSNKSFDLTLNDLYTSPGVKPRIESFDIKQSFDFNIKKPVHDDPFPFNLFIKDYRKKFDLSLKDLASIVGLSIGRVSDIEHGRKPPNIFTLFIFLDAFNKLSVASGENFCFTFDDLISFD